MVRPRSFQMTTRIEVRPTGEGPAYTVTTDASPHLFWITSRAAGTAALVLASLAVCLGLLMSTRLLKRAGGPDLRVAHEALSLATLVAIAVHGLALLGDNFMHPSFADIAVPFVSGFKTGWTTLGIVSGWALLALGLSYYARVRIGAQRWRRLHRFTALAWLAGLVLYPTDLVPADLDGDGSIDPAYRVGGIDVGYERFDAGVRPGEVSDMAGDRLELRRSGRGARA